MENASVLFKRIMLGLLLALLAVAVIAVIAIIIVSEMAKKQARPIINVADQVSGITGENCEFRMDESYRTRDEIQVLAESFEDLSLNIGKYLKEIAAVTSEREKVFLPVL